MFGEAKQSHQLIQFRLRGLHKVNIQALLIAAGQNIKRLLKYPPSSTPQTPAPSTLAILPFPAFEPLFGLH
jgi:hypothetical protein